jgi:hypothetical protein
LRLSCTNAIIARLSKQLDNNTGGQKPEQIWI